MRRAIVHIGMPRTGTTTIQTVLAKVRIPMAAAGVLYPDLTPASAAHEPHISHQHFGEALDGRRPERERRELLAKLDAALAGTHADTVLLSYEDFIQEKRAAAIAGLLRDCFARRGFQMEAVVTVKPQSEHLNSIYAHRAQMIREKRLFEAFARGWEHSGRFAYDRLLLPWLAACSGRVRALPVRDRRSSRPLLERFLAETGLEPRTGALLAKGDSALRENRSPGPVAVEASRRLRMLRAPDRLTVRPREMMRVLERMAFERGVDEAAFRGVGPALRDRYLETHDATNQRFAERIWGMPWTAVVAAEPETAVNELGGRPIPRAMEKLVTDLMVAACQAFGLEPVRRWSAGPRDLVEDVSDTVGRVLRISRWRVL